MRDLKKRTQMFALDCWHFCKKIPKSREYNAFVNQLTRSSSSVDANWQASQRARSHSDFLNKLKMVGEEVDESMYWLEILMRILDDNQKELIRLHDEGNELLAITVSSINTARKRIKNENKG